MSPAMEHSPNLFGCAKPNRQIEMHLIVLVLVVVLGRQEGTRVVPVRQSPPKSPCHSALAKSATTSRAHRADSSVQSFTPIPRNEFPVRYNLAYRLRCDSI